MDIISDREFDHLAADLPIAVRAACWEMWRDDLNTQMLPAELVHGANSILAYFGSRRIVSDVQWDDEGNCFLWEVQYNNIC